MELRVLRGHEIKEFAQLFNDDQKFSMDIMMASYHKDILFIGAFDQKLVGAIGIYDFKKIVYFWIQNQRVDIARQLINMAITLTQDDLYIESFVQWKELCLSLGFQRTDRDNQLVYHHKIMKRFTEYKQVHDFIASQKQRVYALDNFRHFMQDMGTPQILLKTIHIGGTNGKGSTTNYMRSVLQKAGYKVATFTSPVLVTRLEIMRINDQHIQEDEIITYANRYMDLWLEYELSMFEIEVFIAIMFFIKHRVDFAIFEVGLGGELDATNIVSPLICANTNIGLDHIDYLGDTYEKIARTKAGIVKEGIPFVTGEKNKFA
ncbi:Mur ligase family protein [Allocoprobacillus halotolerans]|uniref:Mur ligase family protein n=1 Tax=Allocoprobacillus halotolerans TaxID=2944914 RepID=A0ABY5I263_9FIRM|nr:Mur ligase family protein [Allocoprobacillus halotolerans]UTY38857.1 Mur ligase family protein [Allocoprobacillus halotolerans]